MRTHFYQTNFFIVGESRQTDREEKRDVSLSKQVRRMFVRFWIVVTQSNAQVRRGVGEPRNDGGE